jgi:hypothetical protein
MLGSAKSTRLVLILGTVIFLLALALVFRNNMRPHLDIGQNPDGIDLNNLTFTVEVDWKTLVDCDIGYSEFQRAFIDAVEKQRPKDAEEAGKMVLWCWNRPYQLKSLAAVRNKK